MKLRLFFVVLLMFMCVRLDAAYAEDGYGYDYGDDQGFQDDYGYGDDGDDQDQDDYAYGESDNTDEQQVDDAASVSAAKSKNKAVKSKKAGSERASSTANITLQQAIKTLEDDDQRKELVKTLKAMLKTTGSQGQGILFFNGFLVLKEALKDILQQLKVLGNKLTAAETWKIKFNFSNLAPSKKDKSSAINVWYIVLIALLLQLTVGYFIGAALPPFFARFNHDKTSQTLLKTSISLGVFLLVGYGVKTYAISNVQTSLLLEHMLLVFFMLQFSLMLLKYSIVSGLLPVQTDAQKSLFNLLSIVLFGWFAYVYLGGSQLLQFKRPTVGISTPILQIVFAVFVLMAIAAFKRYKHVVNGMLFRPFPVSHKRLLEDVQQTFANVLHYLILVAIVLTYITWFVGYAGAFSYFKTQLLTTLIVLLALSVVSHIMLYSSRYFHTTLKSQHGFSNITHKLIDTLSFLGLSYIAYSWLVPAIQYAGVSTENASDKLMGIFVIVTITILVIHALNSVFNSALIKRGRYNKHLKTFLPIVDRLSKFFVLVIAAILLLLELNVNMLPILASFSVIGLGVGLASKTIIEDFINGLFLIQENDFNVDDYVTVGNTSGVIEGITLRKLHIRDSRGFLHFIPFSSINTVVNRSRDYNIEKVEVPLPSRFHLKRTVNILEDVGRQLFENSELADYMVSAPRFLGVSRFESNAQNSEEIVTLMQFEVKTQPGKLSSVTGEFRKLVKLAFEEMERVM